MFYGRSLEGHTIVVDSDKEAKVVTVHIDRQNTQGEDDEVLKMTMTPQEALDLTRAFHVELGLPPIPAGAKLFL